ncbi:MAG: DUF2490 domain-containing protein [Bacteroidales bacterium]|nr:DUF2490 domain-containing protein [Bacteroidales bacterium]
MKYTSILIAVIILLLPSLLRAQEKDDYGCWTDIQINKSWSDGSTSGGPYIGLRGEFRTKNNFQSTDIWFIRPTVGYKFNNWLKSDISYDWCQSGLGLQHKFLFSATGTLKSGPLSVSVREMYVRILTTSTGQWSNLLRSKMTAQYAIPDCGIKPYLAIEVFTWTKWINTRHFVGAQFPLLEGCSADLFYLYLTTAGTSSARHIAGLGLNVQL